MDTTDCLGLPFPQCAPPLTKDASDIEQFEALAQATDAAVQTLADAVDTQVISPDMVLMTGGVTTTGRDITHFYGGIVEWDRGGMSDTVADVIRVVRSGWYMIGGWVRGTHGVDAGIGIRIDPLVNGDPISQRQGPGRPTIAGASATDDVAWTDFQFMNQGDVLNAMTHHSGSTALSVTYSSHIWAILVAAND